MEPSNLETPEPIQKESPMRPKSLLLASSFLAAAFLAAPSHAAVVTYNLDVEFSGATAPSGPAPWATASFDDSYGGPNTVRLTMTTGGLTGSEFLSGWYFNLDPA